MTVFQLYKRVERELKIENASFEARQIVYFVCGLTSTSFLMESNRIATIDETNRAKQAVARRNEGTPLYYIIGKTEFYSIELKVTPDTLIPRADSELIVDLALDMSRRCEIKKACDLCSGTGAIGIAFAKNSTIETDCVELYDGAYEVLKTNVEKCKYAHAIKADATEFDLSEYTLITCNPPYISRDEMGDLSKEVLNEPHTALFADDDGLSFYKKISKNVCPGTYIIFETGYKQGDSVRQILVDEGFKDVKIHLDYNRLQRAVTGYKPR